MIHAPQFGIHHGVSRGQRVSRSCLSKVRYATEDRAITVAARACERVSLRVYGCPDCGGWHLTSQVQRWAA